MLVERRRERMPATLLARVALIWAAVSVLLLLAGLAAISPGHSPDPDDVAGIGQIRSFLPGANWSDLIQHRVNTPLGAAPAQWSQLADIPLLLLVAMLTPLAGPAAAETAATLALPLFTLGAAMVLAARLAWRVNGEDTVAMTCLAMALSVPLLFQMGPLRVDDHGWQVVCALLAMNGLAARNPLAGGWLTGLALAVWIAISFEDFPLALAAGGIAALRWLRNRCERMWLVHVTQALAAGSIAIFLAIGGWRDLATHCDAIGPIHIAMLCSTALAFSALARVGPMPMGALLGGFLLAIGSALGILLLGAPACASITGIGQLWQAQAGGSLPLWQQDVSAALDLVMLPLLGIWAALQLAHRGPDWLRRWWTDYCLLLIAALCMTIILSRTGALAAALASVPLGWQLRHWFCRMGRMRGGFRRALAAMALALLLMPSLIFRLAPAADPALGDHGAGSAGATAPQSRAHAALDAPASR